MADRSAFGIPEVIGLLVFCWFLTSLIELPDRFTLLGRLGTRKALRKAIAEPRVSPYELQRALSHWSEARVEREGRASVGHRWVSWEGTLGKVAITVERYQCVAWNAMVPAVRGVIDDSVAGLKRGRRTPKGVSFLCKGSISQAERDIRSAIGLMDLLGLGDLPVVDQCVGLFKFGHLTPKVLKAVLANIDGGGDKTLAAEVRLTILQLGSAPLTMVLARSMDPPRQASTLHDLFLNNAPDFNEQPEALKMLTEVAGAPGVDSTIIDAALVYAAAGAHTEWAKDAVNALAGHHSDEPAALGHVLKLGPGPHTAELCRKRIGEAQFGGQLALSEVLADDAGAVSLADEPG